MKTKLLMSGILMATAALLPAATNDLSTALQKGLFEEEANHNLSAAIQAYQSVITQLDEARNLSATAVFRLGECYRKQGKTNDAIAQFERILRDFSDLSALVTASRENLAVLGRALKPVNAIVLDAVERSELERQLAELRSLPKEKARIEVQQIFPNPVLNSLMQKLAEAEQNLSGLLLDFGPQHREVVKARSLIETINHQIDAQVEGVLNGLELKRATAGKSPSALPEPKAEAQVPDKN